MRGKNKRKIGRSVRGDVFLSVKRIMRKNERERIRKVSISIPEYPKSEKTLKYTTSESQW
jgi:hypothetical protein